MINGYPPIVIKKEDRLKYYQALDKVHTTSDYSKFLQLGADLVLESEKLWIKVLE